MIMSRTPMRASFFGGGSDFEGYYRNGYGKVISTAIDMYIYICISKKFDDLIRVSYSVTELVEHVDDIKHNLIREALKIAEIEKGIDIIYIGDIPLGSAGIGLASSSAITVGILNALFAYKGQHVSPEFLAKKACEIEIKILNNPIGKQDQYAVSYGGFNSFTFNKDGSVFVNPVICRKETKKKLESKLMFFFTGITRNSSGILLEQKEKIVDTTPYIDKLVEITELALDAILSNNLKTIGELLHESWLIKKKLSGNISNGIIDDYYNKAINAGATGGKILGAGGGGFFMFFVDEKYQQNVREALSDLREIPMSLEPQGSKIVYVNDQ